MRRLKSALRAQAAMEFLMTYGWAILVVLIIISVLAYFGALKPGGLLPEKCTFPSGINCVDHSVDAAYVTVTLFNGLGRAAHISGMTATGEALGAGNLCTTSLTGEAPIVSEDCPTSVGVGDNGCVGGALFDNGETKAITMLQGTCLFVDTGRDVVRYNVTFYYSWADSTTFLHTMSGDLFARKP